MLAGAGLCAVVVVALLALQAIPSPAPRITEFRVRHFRPGPEQPKQLGELGVPTVPSPAVTPASRCGSPRQRIATCSH
jgi:hypothetical protein